MEDLSCFLPPNTTTDARAWDDYWKAQLDSDFVDVADMFCDDRELVDYLRREELATGLCVGPGLSLEPLALAQAGFDITALDLSPLAARALEAVDPRGDYALMFFEEYQRREGGRASFVSGDLRDESLCPGPFDFVIERRTLQVFEPEERDAVIDAVVRRLAERGVFLSHCHDGGWRPPKEPEHTTRSWFESRGWPIGLQDGLQGRCFLPIVSTG